MSIRNGQVRNRPECSQVNLLIGGGTWIVGPGAYSRRVVVDVLNGVIWQQFLRQLCDVEPLVGRTFEGTVVEVEAVYVDVGQRHA